MTSPVYCILSGGSVHCVPVTAFNTSVPPAKLARTPEVAAHAQDVQPLFPAVLKIKNKNLLYTLNNPSLLDLESENTGRGSQNDASQDDEDSDPAPESVLQVTRVDLSDIVLWQDEGREKTTIDIKIDEAPQEDILSILNEYSTHAVYLPQYSVDLQTNLGSNYTQIKTLLAKVFPLWTLEIKVKQLTGGITNMLLSCTHVPSNETLLMRVYGQGTNLIIDRHREFVLHLVLNSLKLAPSIHARFSNGLIYGFLPGRSLDPKELSNPYLFPLIAQQLGNWHNSINCENIEDGVEMLRKYTAGLKELSKPQFSKPKREKRVKRVISSVWDLIEDWIQIVPANDALVANFQLNLPGQDVDADNLRHVIKNEFRWLKSTLNRATKSSEVVSHCDLLSGNIIIPDTEEFAARMKEPAGPLPALADNPIQFIDYEYMLPAPRAFDIANHFAEWQGFDCDRSAIPDPSPNNPVLVAWCKGYLNNEKALDAEIGALIDEIACYYGMPGFYWGIWAMIQSELSTIDFNYAEYSELRLEEYWEWKKRFLSSRTIS